MKLKDRTDKSSPISATAAQSIQTSLSSEDHQWIGKIDSTHLIVQIPCLNEEENIGSVIASIRAATADIGRVTVLVIDVTGRLTEQ